MMSRFGEFVIAKQKPLLTVNTILIIVLAAMVPLNELNDKFVEYFDESVPSESIQITPLNISPACITWITHWKPMKSVALVNPIILRVSPSSHYICDPCLKCFTYKLIQTHSSA